MARKIDGTDYLETETFIIAESLQDRLLIGINGDEAAEDLDMWTDEFNDAFAKMSNASAVIELNVVIVMQHQGRTRRIRKEAYFLNPEQGARFFISILMEIIKRDPDEEVDALEEPQKYLRGPIEVFVTQELDGASWDDPENEPDPDADPDSSLN